MTTYDAVAVSVGGRFLGELTDLPKDAQRRARRVINSMRTGIPADARQLSGVDGIYRVRCGDYRILFTRGDRWVHLYSIQHRQGVYKGRLAAPLDAPAATGEIFPEPDVSEETGSDRDTELPYPIEQLERAGLETFQHEALTEWDGTPEALERLVEMGIPDYLLDPLMERFAARSASSTTMRRDIRLVRRDVIDSFFAPLLSGVRMDHPIEELVLVSPWITPWESRTSSLRGVCNFIRRRRIPTHVVTRPPDMPAHEDALAALDVLPTVEISYLDNLHAKFYVCDLAPHPRSLLSSANSTRGSFANVEVGVLVTGRGELEGYVRELQSLTTELRAMSQPRPRG